MKTQAQVKQIVFGGRKQHEPMQGVCSVHFRNNIRIGRQFVYEPADCRLFCTVESALYQEQAWREVYAAHWGNGTCVAGSTPSPEARNFLGAKRLSSWPLDLNEPTNNVRISGASAEPSEEEVNEWHKMIVGALGALVFMLILFVVAKCCLGQHPKDEEKNESTYAVSRGAGIVAGNTYATTL